ncbi:unnamed protein product [Rodentolepis nana]|uniref:Peptidase_M16 domain-containing protein n=1 Tax=Rodentolepis nana TaxID=102285 RepID=A0A0R3TZN1_RODNA|nr:unnamed protein product [Rodentolepis nana]
MVKNNSPFARIPATFPLGYSLPPLPGTIEPVYTAESLFIHEETESFLVLTAMAPNLQVPLCVPGLTTNSGSRNNERNLNMVEVFAEYCD